MEDETVHAYDIPITVNLIRPGRYLYKGFAFYVTKNGKSFLEYGGTSVQFKYDLALLNAGELDHRKVAALEGVVREGLATKKQKELWILCLNARMLKHAYRQSRIYRRKRLKRH